MTQDARQGLSKSEALTETDYRELVARALDRLVAAHGLERVALKAGCDVRTIRNARDQRTSLHGASLMNLMTLDRQALAPLLEHFGACAVPTNAADAPDYTLLAKTAHLVALHGAALADGHVDHREAIELTQAARPVVAEWAGYVARRA